MNIQKNIAKISEVTQKVLDSQVPSNTSEGMFFYELATLLHHYNYYDLHNFLDLKNKKKVS